MYSNNQSVSRRNFLFSMGTVSGCILPWMTFKSNKPVSIDRKGSSTDMKKAWEHVEEILSRIHSPSFPGKTFNVKNFGEPTDILRDSRPAIIKAIHACNSEGGGRVLFPAGEYLINGPLHLKSNINLHLEKGAVLRFGINPKYYLVGPPETKGCVLVRWEGVWCYNYSPLIYALNVENIAITGEGIIDGQTDKFWADWYIQNLHQPDRERLYQFGMEQTPVEERIFGPGHHLAAGTIEFYHCRNILIQGITTRMPLERTIHPVFCENITVRNVNIQEGVLKARNDDGIDPDSSSDILIEGCTFHNYDDAIALKSGRAKEGWVEKGGRATENVVIRNNVFHGEHNGVSTGSDMSGGIRNVYVFDCQFGVNNRQMYVFNAKSNCDRGGIVENIYFKDIKVGSCERLMRMEMQYKDVQYDPVVHPFPPTFRSIHFENVICNEADEVGIDIRGLEQSPVQNVTLKDVRIAKAKLAYKLDNVTNIKMDAVDIM